MSLTAVENLGPELLSPHGIHAVSKYYAEHPYSFEAGGTAEAMSFLRYFYNRAVATVGEHEAGTTV